MSVEIKENKVQVGDHKIHCVAAQIHGHTPENTLLLMPSTLGSSSLDFWPQLTNLPLLLPNYRLISWDPPGFGHSIPPARRFSPEMFENDARLAHELMKQLGIEKFDILGLSGGGVTAIYMAILFPASVGKVVAVSCHSHIKESEMRTYEYTKDVSKWLADVRDPLYEFYGAAYVNESWTSFVDALWRIYREKGGNYFRDRLDQIRADLLVMLGEKDGMIALDHAKDFEENVGRCRVVVIEGGKHKMNLQFPEKFNEIVAEFLRVGGSKL